MASHFILMFKNPASLQSDLDTLEAVEKASLRMVTQAIYLFRHDAAEIFANEKDQAGDIAEDITREALDKMGVSKIDMRLFGKMDYKRARYFFHPDFALKQALFVDSKAEKGDESSATIQTSQTSMEIRQVRNRAEIRELGKLPTVISDDGGDLLVTTIFVKYNYRESRRAGSESPDIALNSITLSCIPNGMLQDIYNPTCEDTIWRAGRDAPTLGEAFRVRLKYDLLRSKMPWRIQTISLDPDDSFTWGD